SSHTRLFDELPLERLVTTKEKKGPNPPPRRPTLTERRRGSSVPSGLHEHGKVDGIYTVRSEEPKRDAEKLLRPFLSKAFRRPAPGAQIPRSVGMVEERLKANDGFEEGMRMAYTAALCSPEFLFRLEKPGKLDDWAIATRLSFFLWNSVPDDELNDLARRGEL